MKGLRIKLVFFFFVLFVGILFKDSIYQKIFSYTSIGQRSIYPATNLKLKDYIQTYTKDNIDTNVENIIKSSLYLTSNHLNFTTDNNDINPNLLISSKNSHCVGYCAFFSTICNYILRQRGKENEWLVRHHIGQIHVGKKNIHNYFQSPFFKNHDFVTVENINNGKIYAIDPTVYDYFRINYICFIK